MKEATKLLLTKRKNSKYVEVVPKKYRGAKLNMCFQNAATYSANKNEYSIVSGWKVGDFFASVGTILVPHYWLIHDETGIYYDTSPNHPDDNQNYEYVVDMDIYKNVTRTSYIPPAVLVTEGGLLQARLGEKRFYEIDKIDVVELYSLVR